MNEAGLHAGTYLTLTRCGTTASTLTDGRGGGGGGGGRCGSEDDMSLEYINLEIIHE